MKYIMLLVQIFMLVLAGVFLSLFSLGLMHPSIYVIFLSPVVGLFSVLMWFYNDSNNKSHKIWFWLSSLSIPLLFVIVYIIQTYKLY